MTSNSPKILLFGANGQLGARLKESCAVRGWECVSLARQQCDLSVLRADMVQQLIDEHAPSHIINAAAYTAVNKAEEERDSAFGINAAAPQVMAKVTRLNDIPFVHFSTDYVLDGARGAPYSEDAPVRPLNVYGASKLQGERATLEENATVFRLQWVYDTRGSNFMLQMRKHFAAQQSMRIVADQLGAPSFAKHIAQAVLDGLQLSSGLYHLANAGFTSWHGFACAIHAMMSHPTTKTIQAITAEEYPSPVVRPRDTRLAMDKLAAHSIILPHWAIGLREAMEELK